MSLPVRRIVAPLIASLVGLVALGSALGPAAQAATPPLIAPPPPGSSTTGPLVGTTADDGARVIAQKQIDARTVDITVRSPAMGLDLPVRVMTPPGWSPTATRTWPLALALHGGNDDYSSWNRRSDVEQLSSTWGVIVATPEAGRTAAYTDYVRTTAQGPLKWETFHTVEVVQILERGFRASNQRAAFGISGGGYGVMTYATRHPGMFKYAASFSGMIAVNQFPLQQITLEGDKAQGTGDARYGDPNTNRANWDAHDPFKQVKNLRGTGVYVYSGLTGIPSETDTVPWGWNQLGEAYIGNQNQSFALTLMFNGVPATTNFSITGEHDWVSWQVELHKAWPAIMASIGAQKV